MLYFLGVVTPVSKLLQVSQSQDRFIQKQNKTSQNDNPL